jgi:archaeal type IV pilus assembly protein PilA
MMHYRRRISRKNGEDGVSPVVGVMLMLVVTIIIAAVVSAFAGSTVSGTSKAPAASMEIHIKNGGSTNDSYFQMNVLGVSDPIPTKNLVILTSWQTTNKTTGSSGETLTGGKTSSAVAVASRSGDLVVNSFKVPTGYGNGVANVSNDTYHTPEAQWGNFSLTSGTSTFDRPVGYSSYSYNNSTNSDPMKAILGSNWYQLRAGDIVAVRVLDVKSGKEIVDQNIVVEGP